MRASCTRQVTIAWPSIGSPVRFIKNETNSVKPDSSALTVICWALRNAHNSFIVSTSAGIDTEGIVWGIGIGPWAARKLLILSWAWVLNSSKHNSHGVGGIGSSATTLLLLLFIQTI